jgi:hypothetical protein
MLSQQQIDIIDREVSELLTDDFWHNYKINGDSYEDIDDFYNIVYKPICDKYNISNIDNLKHMYDRYYVKYEVEYFREYIIKKLRILRIEKILKYK